MRLVHDEHNASIRLDDDGSCDTPWTPKSLGRAKTAMIYKHTLNDTLLVLERTLFFRRAWVPYFVSLQDHRLVFFASREQWEQGRQPDKVKLHVSVEETHPLVVAVTVIELHAMLLLGEMKVESVVASYFSQQASDGSARLFHQKVFEPDELDTTWSAELAPDMVGSARRVDNVAGTNRNALTHCILEFGSYNQSTFELWTKAIRRLLRTKRERERKRVRSGPTEELVGTDASHARSKRDWVSPGHDANVTLLKSELWCNRVLSGDKEKAESEMRRIVAMEKLVDQISHPEMALLVYEKVSRVHELFVANSRREMEGLDGRARPIPAHVLHFFTDHLKRKYAVFLMLALTYGVDEEEIRAAHERMCRENGAVHAGVGGGSGEQQRSVASYGFADPASLSLYEKYRDAAWKYHRVNYGDTSAAEDEDAIMHLPVMLHIAIVRQDVDESAAMRSILNAVKARLVEHCTGEKDSC
ncbi:hypothetical protein PsorP6_009344 [Peronosclerospora sorghi]|uniref:Uncharacterized protein n=1 Tax=Peronosclerospora sorghi TaxID=230839 RepID=A0ACC0VZG1_9STRA|nr:hypothetical protein PsorP6_009344 [Peronosclerospora sorghi]